MLLQKLEIGFLGVLSVGLRSELAGRSLRSKGSDTSVSTSTAVPFINKQALICSIDQLGKIKQCDIRGVP